MMKFQWPQFKAFIDSRALSIQWVDDGESYYLVGIDGYFSIQCQLNKNNLNDYLLDFETNYKANGNKPIITNTKISSSPSYGSKTLVANGVVKSLFARNTGKQYALTAGSNDLIYTITFPWVKMIGIECVGGELLDTAELKVYDTAAGSYSGVPNALLNQFGYALNIAPGFYSKESPFDADLYAGMVLKITYTSISSKTIGLNFLLNEVK